MVPTVGLCPRWEKKFGRTDRDFFGLFAAGSESDDVDVLSCLDVELGRSVQNQVR